jgi:meso-butanediol dehydrogenase / (S,S)-butanediol dehydrogenase / diacetyl reductase
VSTTEGNDDRAVTAAGVAVVTGAGSGIGQAIAFELAARGWQVVVTDIDETSARGTAERCGGQAMALDVVDSHATTSLVERVVTECGPLGLWVANAGVSKMQRFVDISPADLATTLDVNTKGVFYGGQAAARQMISEKRGGVIVNIASMAGKQGGVPFLADYVASKFAVVGLTQAMALELAADHIRVNCVCPGFVETSMQARELEWEAQLRASSPAAVEAAMVAGTPLGRLAQAADVARVVAFLASPDAEFVTGEALAVNGGAYMD